MILKVFAGTLLGASLAVHGPALAKQAWAYWLERRRCQQVIRQAKNVDDLRAILIDLDTRGKPWDHQIRIAARAIEGELKRRTTG